jgi:hypothetical protein
VASPRRGKRFRLMTPQDHLTRRSCSAVTLGSRFTRGHGSSMGLGLDIDGGVKVYRQKDELPSDGAAGASGPTP